MYESLEAKVREVDAGHVLREREWPRRGEGAQALFDAVTGFFQEALRRCEAGEHDFIFQHDLSAIEAVVGQPVVIGGPMKSGTTLLTQLLDDHPQLIVFPGDAKMLRTYDKLNETNAETFIKRYFHYLSATGGRTKLWYFGGHDRARQYLMFLFYFLEIRKRVPGGNNIAWLLRALACMHHEKHGVYPSMWIEKTPNNEMHFSDIEKIFPATRFVVSLRDPYDNFHALAKNAERHGRDTNILHIALNLRATYGAIRAFQKTARPALIVEYENVVSDLAGAMRRICDFLTIEWRDSLTVPTIWGQPASSNSVVRAEEVTGVVLSRRSRRENLRLRERLLVLGLCMQPYRAIER